MASPNHPKIQYSNIPSQGFTLVEILLVVVIILIAAGVSVPLFRGTFQSTQMRDAVRSTVRLTRYARSLSILRQQPCTLEFTNGLVRLSCGGGTNGPAGEQITRRFPEDIQIADFESIRTGKPHKRATFYASGVNDGFEVTLRDRRERRTTIECDPYSGKVTVDE